MTNTEMDTAIRTLKAEYAKEWRRRNPDKVRANNRRYRERHPDIVRANSRRYWERQVEKQQAAEAKNK